MRKTKIICTIGPACDNPEVLRAMILAGMNVARINFSHGTHEHKQQKIAELVALREELDIPVALLADTKGPEVRLGLFPGGKVLLKEGQRFTLTTQEVDCDDKRACVSYAHLPNDVQVGGHILLDDGLIDLRVDSKSEHEIYTTVLNDGEISSRKGVNVPGVSLNLPFISSQDRVDLRFIASQPFSYVAASFTRSAEDVRALRDELARHGNRNIKIIAKIENSEGVQNIEAIMESADGIMVARGDLGVELALEELPALQKKLIQGAYRRGLPAVTATQMLESMIHNPRPTRAETSDVANAVYDGTSAIMLSGETAMGAYPVEAVSTMARIAERAEKDCHYHRRFLTREYDPENTITNAIARATVTTAFDLNCAAIIILTQSGTAARHCAKFRPAAPIVVCTPSPEVRQQLAMFWGVEPLLIPTFTNTDELMHAATEAARKAKILREGDLTVITGGMPLGQAGTTNMMKVCVVGEV